MTGGTGGAGQARLPAAGPTIQTSHGREQGAQHLVMPAAYAYLALPPHVAAAPDAQRAVATARQELAGFAASRGYQLAEVFTDVRGRTESGLYELLAALRGGQAVAVVVPDVGHLRNAGCLAGADLPTATRYLRARLLPMHPDPGLRPTADDRVPIPKRHAPDCHPTRDPEPPWPRWNRATSTGSATSTRRAVPRRARGGHR
jgi:hypothetical protein